MLTKFREKIVRIKRAAGVEIILLPDNKFLMTIVLLTLDKRSVRLEKKEQLENVSPEALKGLPLKDVPVYLILNGRGVLHKKITGSGVDSTMLIQSVLPDAKAKDFYIQNILSEKGSVLSIVRKEIADPIFNLLQKLSLSPVGFSLGGIMATLLFPLIKETEDISTFSWAGHRIERDRSGAVTDYSFNGSVPEEKSVRLDTEKLEQKYLVAYAGAFALLVNHETIVPFAESIVANKEEFLNKKLFELLRWMVLGFFFILLMVNFILFAHYSSRNNELVQKENKYASMLSQRQRLDTEVKEKESFLSEAGWLQSSSATYFADRIAATVPGSVRLTELSIHPVDERKSKEERKEIFSSSFIVLKGVCTRPTELNEWLDRIKLLEHIRKAKLVQYTYDNKEKEGSFSIEIETE